MKKICLIFLLIIITGFIVFIPPFVSGQYEEKITNKITHRDYYASNRPKLTSEQVARLYYNREISIGLNSFNTNTENSDNEIILKDIFLLIDMLFAENELIGDSVKDLVFNSEINCFRSNSLIKINNKPTAINFVSCGTKNEKGYIEIDYEEKTKTIVQFSCYIFDETFENIRDTDSSSSPIFTNYYKKQLNLKDYEYYATLKIIPMDEAHESNHIKRLYIDCGIERQEDENIDVKEYIIYN